MYVLFSTHYFKLVYVTYSQLNNIYNVERDTLSVVVRPRRAIL